MPVYEYKCDSCGKSFELFQKISDPEARKCIFCKGRVRKQISMTTFHLKGGGWYVTDYGGKKAPAVETEKGSSDKCASCSSAETGTSCNATPANNDD